MPAWLSELFTFKGRINRAPYLFINLGISGGWMLLSLLLVGVGPNPDVGVLAMGVLFTVWCASAVIQAAAAVKRLHDIDRPGLHYWLLLVPIYNLYLGFHLMFTHGPTGPNRFGPDPCAPKEVNAWDAPRPAKGLAATACDDWVCTRCGLKNETVCCSRCGAQNFQQRPRRSA